MPRDELERYQLQRLNALLEQVLPSNSMYAPKFARLKRPVESLAEFAEWPFTFKEELIGPASSGGVANNLTWPRQRYSRFHQTSGTSGHPMVLLDTPDDWQWVLECWEYVLDGANITADDCALMAFSFGPHIGFWGAYEALTRRGALAIPTGGMSSLQRLEMARQHSPTVICCTPSYALHLAEVGGENSIDVGQLGVRLLVLAGEPGGSVPAVRQKLQTTWNAAVHDHCGATEIGAWGYGDPRRQRFVRDRSRVHRRVSLAVHRGGGARRRGSRTGDHEFGPRGLPGVSLPDRRCRAADLEFSRRGIASSCSTAACWGVTTTCWSCAA